MYWVLLWYTSRNNQSSDRKPVEQRCARSFWIAIAILQLCLIDNEWIDLFQESSRFEGEIWKKKIVRASVRIRSWPSQQQEFSHEIVVSTVFSHFSWEHLDSSYQSQSGLVKRYYNVNTAKCTYDDDELRQKVNIIVVHLTIDWSK